MSSFTYFENNRKKELEYIEECLKEGKNVVVDDTNLTQAIWKQHIDLVKRYNAKAIGIFMNTSTGMLIHYLESFTDSLVVTEENENPIGVIGGREIIENVFKNPSSEFFDNTTVEQITDKNLVILSDTTSLGELLEAWKKTRRAFSIIPNNLGGYSAISARKVLEIGTNCITDLTISELPKKEVVTFEQDSTIRDIIGLMLEKNTRKLVLKDTNYFISDRLLIQSIAQEFDFFRNVKFLEHKVEKSFKLEEIKKISKDVNLAELSKIMYTMVHPYVLYQDQVVTPWDICMALQSDRIEFLG